MITVLRMNLYGRVLNELYHEWISSGWGLNEWYHEWLFTNEDGMNRILNESPWMQYRMNDIMNESRWMQYRMNRILNESPWMQYRMNGIMNESLWIRVEWIVSWMNLYGWGWNESCISARISDCCISGA